MPVASYVWEAGFAQAVESIHRIPVRATEHAWIFGMFPRRKSEGVRGFGPVAFDLGHNTYQRQRQVGQRLPMSIFLEPRSTILPSGWEPSPGQNPETPFQEVHDRLQHTPHQPRHPQRQKYVFPWSKRGAGFQTLSCTVRVRARSPGLRTRRRRRTRRVGQTSLRTP